MDWGRRRRTRFAAWAVVTATVALGSWATARVLDTEGAWTLSRDRAPELAAAVAVAMGLTIANLALRWFRWHNLVRRTYVRVPTRQSARLYGATLPAMATPFYVAELIRAFLLRHHAPHAAPAVSVVWVLERMADAAVIATLLLAATGRPWAVPLVVAAWIAAHRWIPQRVAATTGTPVRSPAALSLTAATTLAAWILPVFGLWTLTWAVGPSLSVPDAIDAFSRATLIGGVSGLPLGAGVTGLTLQTALRSAGVGVAAAAVVVGAFRAATAWLTIVAGVAIAILCRREIRALLRPGVVAAQQQFETIASSYQEQIPEQTRSRLLGRKVDLIDTAVREAGMPADARGLEVGCGHGWYAAALNRRGYRMAALDLSAGQLVQARDHLTDAGAAVALTNASCEALPYADETFDFAYAINVLHHVVHEGGVSRTMAEVVRVLKPGAPFLLHEMNTRNPLFRFYMGYVFPLLHDIDEGTEVWLAPDDLPAVRGAAWDPRVDYFTFLPEFLPEALIKGARPLEAELERSRFSWASAHFMARLVKASAPLLDEPTIARADRPGI